MMLLLVGCGSKDKVEEVKETSNENIAVKAEDKEEVIDVIKVIEPNGFPFIYNGVTIYMNANAKPIIEALGDPIEYFEAPSCAFQGLDKIYYYNGFELSTYPIDGEDYVSSINFLDDTISTVEGVYLGADIEDMLEAYGEDYKEEMGLYNYSLENSNLSFIVEDDIITAITYLAFIEEE